jgi:hypothetical protein
MFQALSIKIFTSLIFKDKFFRIVLPLSVLLNLILWVVLYLNFWPLRETRGILPLHYNIYFGIDFVGEWYKIFIVPATGIFFIIINFLVADMVYLRDKVVSYFLAGAGLFIQVILGLAALTIISLNQ